MTKFKKDKQLFTNVNGFTFATGSCWGNDRTGMQAVIYSCQAQTPDLQLAPGVRESHYFKDMGMGPFVYMDSWALV